MLNFPIRNWLTGNIRPSEVTLNALFQRRLSSLMRSGIGYAEAKFKVEDEFDETNIRSKYNLPLERKRYTLTLENWDIYVKLNSFKRTRDEARKFLNANKIRVSESGFLPELSKDYWDFMNSKKP